MSPGLQRPSPDPPGAPATRSDGTNKEEPEYRLIQPPPRNPGHPQNTLGLITPYRRMGRYNRAGWWRYAARAL